MGSEKQRGIGDVLWLPQIAHRNAATDFQRVDFAVLFQRGNARRADIARRNGCRADADGAEFCGDAARQHVDAGLGGSIGMARREGEEGVDRAEIEDHAAGFGHERQCLLKRDERAGQVDVENAGEIGGRLLGDRHEAVGNRGIVDQHIDATEVAGDLGKGGGDIGLNGKIGSDGAVLGA